MREFKGKGRLGDEITIIMTPLGDIVIKHGGGGCSLDAASVARLRDWLAEDCCDIRKPK